MERGRVDFQRCVFFGSGGTSCVWADFGDQDFVVMIEENATTDVPAVEQKSADRPSEGEVPAQAAPVIVTAQSEVHESTEPASADAKRESADDLPAQSQNAQIADPPAPVSTHTEAVAKALAPQPVASSSQQSTEPAEKPTSFKDKLAAFNRSAGSAGPPPPLKPKPLAASGGPGTWAWKQKQQQQQHQAMPAPNLAQESQQTDASREHPDPTPSSSGMSASDAKASIGLGGSLKERMAALAGAGAFGGEKTSKGPPPAVGSKPRVWKRPEVAPPSMHEGEGSEGLAAGEGTGEERRDVAKDDAGDVQEDQLEKERRAAIAARMARLGGRGVMGMPMPIGGPKPVAADKVETNEPAAQESKSVGDDVISPVDNAASPAIEAAESPTPESPAPTTIAMPAIPRKAGPPRRKPPTRTATNGSVGSSSTPVETSQASAPPSDTTPSHAEVPIIGEIPSPTTEGDDREIPLPKTREQLLQEREFEEAGAGPNGAEGALAAGIALASADDSLGQQVREVPPDAPSLPGVDDREIPLPRTEGEVAREHEYAKAGKGIQGAEGAKAAGIALADVEEPGEQAGAVPVSSPEASGHAGVHHERSLPPPPLVVDDDDDDDFGESNATEEDDEDDGDDIMKQAASGNLLANPTTTVHQQTPSDTDPVGFQPLQSPAPITSTTKSPITESTETSPVAMLGLPKDEVALKHDAVATAEGGEEDEGDTPPPPPRPVGAGDEGERVKPAGPRPLPPSPGRALPQLQTVQPMAGRSITSPSTAQRDASGPKEDETAPPPPLRQTSVISPAQASSLASLAESQSSARGK